jgi:RHS repeat-associated protein
VREESQQIYYYHGDHLGSAQLVTDYQGKTYEQLEYTPYGELWVEHVPITWATPFRFTGKERDGETGLYYFGARYLNPQTGMWLSADPAMGEYIPQAPINDEAKKHNENLPGLGGVFNYVNLHAYHYAGNNPVVMKDPDGRDFYNFTQRDIVVVLEDEKGGVGYVNVRPGEMYKGRIDGVVLADDTVVKVTGKEWAPAVHLVVETFGDEDIAYLVGDLSVFVNDGGDLVKKINGKDDLLSGVYSRETAKNNGLGKWIINARDTRKVDKNNPDVNKMTVGDILDFAIFRAGTKVPLENRG